MTASTTHATIQAIWKLEGPKLIASLTRMVRDVGRAEELAQDALVSALETWPTAGVPENPGAWLMVTAKRRGINVLHRAKMLDRKHEELGRAMDARADADVEEAIDEDVGDDLLRLMLISCHPLLPREGRVAMTLRLLGGLTTEEIARAFLVPEPTIAQRIVRAKRTLAEAKVPFEVPRGDALAPRLSSVLEVLYLVFNEGYAASMGDDPIRPGLCEDALRLGRVLAELAPTEPEVHGLVALMELHASRTPSRLDAAGDPVLLPEQDRARWDQLSIRRGLAALARADALGGRRGPYALQAAVSACHARARTAADTDWAGIAALYATLGEVLPSPVVELNRAMAVAMARGPAEGLAIIDALAAQPALARYPWLPSAQADLLFKLERWDEARAAFERAAALVGNARDRRLLLARAGDCARRGRPD